MGFKTTCGLRWTPRGLAKPVRIIYWGQERSGLGATTDHYTGDRDWNTSAAACQMGVIYVNPQAHNENQTPAVFTARDIRPKPGGRMAYARIATKTGRSDSPGAIPFPPPGQTQGAAGCREKIVAGRSPPHRSPLKSTGLGWKNTSEKAMACTPSQRTGKGWNPPRQPNGAIIIREFVWLRVGTYQSPAGAAPVENRNGKAGRTV